MHSSATHTKATVKLAMAAIPTNLVSWSGLVWTGLVCLFWSGLVWSGLIWSVWSGLVCRTYHQRKTKAAKFGTKEVTIPLEAIRREKRAMDLVVIEVVLQICKKSKISLDRHFMDGNFPKKARTLEMEHFAGTQCFIVKLTKTTTILNVCFTFYIHIPNYWVKRMSNCPFHLS